VLLDGLCSPGGQTIESFSKIPARATIQEVTRVGTAACLVFSNPCVMPGSGSVTTTVAGHTRAWDLAFRNVPSLLRSSVSQTAARFERAAGSRRRQS